MATKYDPVATGKRLKRAMKDADLTPYMLAKKSGMTTTSIYNYMAGLNVPSLNSAVRIADVLGVDVDWLASGKKREQ